MSKKIHVDVYRVFERYSAEYLDMDQDEARKKAIRAVQDRIHRTSGSAINLDNTSEATIIPCGTYDLVAVSFVGQNDRQKRNIKPSKSRRTDDYGEGVS